LIQHCRSDAVNSRHKNQVSPPIVLISDDVTSGPQSDVCDNPSWMHQGAATSCASFLPHDFRHPLHNLAVGTVTGSASDAVNNLTVSTTRTAVSSWNTPATATQNKKYCEHATKSVADIDGKCSENRKDDNKGGSVVFRFEAVTNTNSDDKSRSTDKQRHAVSPSSSFNVDGPAVARSNNFDAATSSFMRSVSEPDIDIESPSSSLYDVYTESPGSKRRQSQQRRQRQLLDEDVGRSSSSQRQFSPRDDVDDGHGGARSLQGASRHRRKAHSQQVSSSFENLVDSLLAVPQPHWRRHLANATETPTALSSSNNSSSADSLCGRGADFLPALTAFLATETPTTAVRSSPSSLPANPTTVEEPVLPLHTKHAPQHVRRAKHLFKSCQSCVQRRPR